MSESTKVLLHRLNGQLLDHLNLVLSAELKRIGSDWNSRDWIINVILLDRSIETVYAASLETSATLHRGDLIDSPEDYDDDKVSLLGLPVPLDSSFSGHAVITSDVVWISNLSEVENDPTRPHLSRLYREFGHVGVVTPADRPKAEFCFPILIQVGLSHLVVGVLNMEFFASDESRACPLNSENKLVIESLITELLNIHAPYLLIGRPQQVGTRSPERARSQAQDEHQDSLLALHRAALADYLFVDETSTS